MQFEVRTVTVEMEDRQGKSYLGQAVSEMDATRLFEGLPVLDQKYNKTLLMRDRLSSRGLEPHDRRAISGAARDDRRTQALHRAD
jgi:hypothetical protein